MSDPANIPAWIALFLGLYSLAAGVGVFVYAYWALDDPQGWREVPDAFISVLSRMLN